MQRHSNSRSHGITTQAKHSPYSLDSELHIQPSALTLARLARARSQLCFNTSNPTQHKL